MKSAQLHSSASTVARNSIRCTVLIGDDAADPAWIFNQRGAGYRMAEPRDG